MNDNDLTPADAATLTAVLSSSALATPAPAPTPTAAPTTTPTQVEPHSHAGISPAEAAKMSEWTKQDLAQGKISAEQAETIYSELNVPAEDRVTKNDTRTDEQKLLDQHFSAARTEDYQNIQYYVPGQAPPVLPQEVQAFDANARGWMADAGLSREHGNAVVTIISKMIQHTHDDRRTTRDVQRPVECEARTTRWRPGQAGGPAETRGTHD